MEILTEAMILLWMLMIAIYVFSRNGRSGDVDGKLKLLPFLLLMDVCLIASGMGIRTGTGARLMLDLSLMQIPLIFLIYSIWDFADFRRILILTSGGYLTISTGQLLCSFGVIHPLSSKILVWLAVMVMALTSILYVVGLTCHLLNVNNVMKAASSWSYICLGADGAHAMLMLLLALLTLLSSSISGRYSGLHLCLTDLLMSLSVTAIVVRMVHKTAFVIMRKRERTIVESMKFSMVAMPNENDRDDGLYKTIYKRLTEYFEQEKPYLRSELTINDLVQVVYSNKLYISRAISQCTGRNFRQFVNYYRIKYSVDMFRQNPKLKIVDLYQACGFNSVASYNMAFRLFMNENPSEWFRKERKKLLERN